MRKTRRVSPQALGAACVAMVVLATPSLARANYDWIGWLEGFSGPGPFHGGELSLEFVCLDLVDRRVVNASDLEPFVADVKDDVDRALAEVIRLAPINTNDNLVAVYDALIQQFRSLERSGDLIGKRRSSPGPSPTIPIGVALRALQESLREPNAASALTRLQEAVTAAGRRETGAIAAASAGFGRVESTGQLLAVPVQRRLQKRAFGSIRKPQSCRAARRTIEEDRNKERMRSVNLFAPPPRGSSPESDALVVSRRDWTTGLVLGTGVYQSLDNRLTYAPGPSGERDAEPPRVYVIPFELLVHSKLSASIDVGAGVGAALLRTEGNNGRPATNHFAFYYVPLSVVVRPAAMFFPDNRLAAGLGYRISARRFLTIDAADFGAVPGSFSEPGEFLWGHSMFFDLVSLFGH